jgi:hypothetical protein
METSGKYRASGSRSGVAGEESRGDGTSKWERHPCILFLSPVFVETLLCLVSVMYTISVGCYCR